MSEIITNGYRRLFEIRLLHHYWLDQGAALFDTLPAADLEKRLLTYDRRPFLDIAPTPATAAAISGLRCVYKDTALGAVVVAPEDAPVPDDMVLEFVVTRTHSDFNIYTAHSFLDRKITEIFHQPEEKMYRFKTNVFVLENTSGTKRGAALFLSKEAPAMSLPATSYPVESMLINAGNLVEITNETGGTVLLYSGPSAGLPVFVTQGDVPPIVPPAGMVGAPATGLTLTSEYPDNIYALIRIRAVHPTDTDLSCTTGGLAKTTAPVFQVRLKNRLSVWRYRNKTNPSLPFTDTGMLPLTFFGNASPAGPTQRQKPSTGGVKFQFVGNDPANDIEKIISEIYE